MGRATKWLKGFFGFKSSKDPKEFNNSISGPRNDKGRPSFAGPGRDSGGFCRNPAGQGDGWTKKYISETEREQSKHAIAVAAATAAAADAAVAAAQAAVAVVRLTSQGRGGVFGGGGGGRERWAAVKIQTTFRGYLARKALRALKGLVKIQALVRGYLVRKQATATLRGMQALIRAQATVRSKRLICKCPTHAPPESWVHRSSEIFDDTASEHTASVYSRRLSASFESRTTSAIDDTTPKIVEVDMGRPGSRSRRSNPTLLELGDDPFSHPQCPPHLSIPTYQHWYDTDWGAIGEECRLSTTQNTPRFSSNPPVTPTKSVCRDNFYFKQYGNHPNYMGHTKSFKAKVRSQSAPKQRPEMVWPRNKLSMNEVTGSRNSLSGLRMQRSCSHAQQVINFKNVVMGKLERFDS